MKDPMAFTRSQPARGFLLIEALVALLILTVGLLGLSTLYSHVTGAAGEAKSRSQAMAQASSKIDELRNLLLEADYTASLPNGTTATTATVDGLEYSMSWTVTDTVSGLQNKLVQVGVSWLDRAGNTQTVNLNTILGWNDPARGLMTQYRFNSVTPKPKGEAQRKPGIYRPGDVIAPPTTNPDTKVTTLMSADGVTPLLELQPSLDGSAQKFITINGRVYIDQSANRMPESTAIYLRLSSEGQCVFDNRDTSAQRLRNYPENASGSSIVYKYFTYTCYVGPGWYGNLGVEIQETSSLPTICAGDPAFTDASFSASPASTEATFRSYRGFRAESINGATTYITTGMASSTTTYTYGDDGSSGSGITSKGGKPKPSEYPGVYGTPATSDDYLRQDFLVTRVTGQASCRTKMQLAPAAFSRNAGKNVCISPDNSSSPDQCPTVWPGQTVGACTIQISGSFNPTLQNPNTSVSCAAGDNANCSCSLIAGTANYSCTTTGGSTQSVTLTGVASSRGDRETCVRTISNVGCGSQTGINIDPSLASCTVR